jgi:hypothetical protein
MIHFQLWFLLTVITCTTEENKPQLSHYLLTADVTYTIIYTFHGYLKNNKIPSIILYLMVAAKQKQCFQFQIPQIFIILYLFLF